MSDSFFDMPAGYSDADMEMSALVEAGNRHARRVRRFGETNLRALEAGETITRPCRSKETGESYTVAVKFDDGDILYSVDGRTWHDSAREAHTAARKG